MNSKIMAIINVTEDSFYAPSRVAGSNDALDRAQQFIAQGADILDIGGESTRPQAVHIPEEEELDRVIPVIRAIRKTSDIPISIDTSKPRVAQAAIDAGANLINDVTGFQSREMVEVACRTQAELCVMHMQGTPQTMQQNPSYEKGVVHETIDWLRAQTEMLIKAGVRREKIITDPGIGFGKTVHDNIAIMQNIAQYKALGLRLLIGVSRKSFLSRILEKKSEDLLAGTLAVNAMLMLAGVDIIRVHDVQEHRDLRAVIDLFRN